MPSQVMAAPVAAPCTQAQIDQIKQLASQMRTLDPGFAARFVELLKKKPLNTFSLSDADKLIVRLTSQVSERHIESTLVQGSEVHS